MKLRLVKRGSDFYLYVARKGEELHLAGGSMRLELKEPFYIGLGVCSHDKDSVETAVFSNVSIGTPGNGKPKLFSTLETISVSSTDGEWWQCSLGGLSGPVLRRMGTLSHLGRVRRSCKSQRRAERRVREIRNLSRKHIKGISHRRMGYGKRRCLTGVARQRRQP